MNKIEKIDGSKLQLVPNQGHDHYVIYASACGWKPGTFAEILMVPGYGNGNFFHRSRRPNAWAAGAAVTYCQRNSDIHITVLNDDAQFYLKGRFERRRYARVR